MRIRKDFPTYSKILVLYEILIFFLTLTFFILVFVTHPPSATCDIVQAQTWVLVFTIIFSIPSIFPLFVYSVYFRKDIRIRNFCNQIRIGTIIMALVFCFGHSFRGGCRLYLNLYLYELIFLIYTILPTLVQIVVIVQRKIQENSNKKD